MYVPSHGYHYAPDKTCSDAASESRSVYPTIHCVLSPYLLLVSLSIISTIYGNNGGS